MKKSTMIPLILVITGNLFSSCNSDFVDVKPEIYAMKIETMELNNSNEAIATAQKSVNSDFEKFVVKTKAIISRNELNIKMLKSQLDNNVEINNEILLIVDGICKRNDALKIKLDNYVSTGTGNWKIFESEIQYELDNFFIAYNDASAYIIK